MLRRISGRWSWWWQRRERLRLPDALYVELASVLDVRMLTADVALGRATRRAELISA